MFSFVLSGKSRVLVLGVSLIVIFFKELKIKNLSAIYSVNLYKVLGELTCR